MCDMYQRSREVCQGFYWSWTRFSVTLMVKNVKNHREFKSACKLFWWGSAEQQRGIIMLFSLSLFLPRSEKEYREMSQRLSSEECHLPAQQWLCQGWASNVELEGSFCDTQVPALHPRKLDSLVKHRILPLTYKAITCCLVAFGVTD